MSSASVSNALNGRKGVSPETVKKIQAIAQEMGYIHESSGPAARNFIRLVIFKRHGLIVMDTQFFAELIESIDRQCRQLGYEVVITHIHKENDPDYQERIASICHEECAGILLLATEMHKEDARLFAHTSAPLLVLDSLFEGEPFNTVVMNNAEAGYMAAEYLLQKGHRKIDHITASVRFNNMKFRREGYEAALRDHGIAFSKKNIWRVTPTLEGAYNDMLALLESPPEDMPTAFFAANDIIAVGSARALAEKGYAIPEQISIIGMDDLEICQIASPPLSTIHVFRQDIGKIAVMRLVDIMNQDSPHSIQKTQVSVALTDRQSVRDLREE